MRCEYYRGWIATSVRSGRSPRTTLSAFPGRPVPTVLARRSSSEWASNITASGFIVRIAQTAFVDLGLQFWLIHLLPTRAPAKSANRRLWAASSYSWTWVKKSAGPGPRSGRLVGALPRQPLLRKQQSFTTAEVSKRINYSLIHPMSLRSKLNAMYGNRPIIY